MLLGRSYRPNKSQPLAYYRARPIAVLWAGSGYAHAQEYTKHVVLSQRVWLCKLEIEVRVMVASAGMQTKARPRRVNFIVGKWDVSKYAPVRRVGNTHLKNYFHAMYTEATVGYT